MRTKRSNKAAPAPPQTARDLLALAMAHQAQGRFEQSFEAYQQVLALEPKSALAYTHLGSLLITEYRLDLAISVLRFVTTLEPTSAIAHFNLGNVLVLQDFIDEATPHLEEAVRLAPDAFEPLASLVMLRQHICDWAGLDEQHARLSDLTLRSGNPLAPFTLLTFERRAAAHLICATRFAAAFTKAPDRRFRHAPRAPAQRARRLRVGFVSADYHTHATLMLMIGMLEAFDTSRFELIGYSLGLDDHGPLRRRAVEAFGRFVELRGLTDAEAAARIHADDVDILIDLKGHTQHARTAIFAFRPAPIQVSYLGYPGTMGMDVMDYLIADAFVAPTSDAPLYTEKLVHLPDCYQPNDRCRLVADDAADRVSHHLPRTGFVFCCFNNSFKITAAMFDIWMRLLRATPGAVLWLLEPNGRVAANLRREALARGVEGRRLVFAPRLPAPQHLARLRCADLFLDTLPYNAHTTASEALWVGLPVLTCVGEAFAGRVAGSLLAAIDLPALITSSLADYEARALALAHDPPALERLRDRLKINRFSTSLFDTARYTRHFEDALLQMAARRDSGHPPEAFAVAPRDPETVQPRSSPRPLHPLPPPVPEPSARARDR